MPYRTLARKPIGIAHSFRVDVHVNDGYDGDKNNIFEWLRGVFRDYKDGSVVVNVESLDVENPSFDARLLSELLGLPRTVVEKAISNSLNGDSDLWGELATEYFGKSGTRERNLMYMFGVLLRGFQ